MRYVLALTLAILGPWASAILNPAGAQPRILILHPYDQTLPASIRAGDAVRAGLIKHYGETVDIYSEYLELNRFSSEEHRRIAANYLAQKFASKPISLTVALGPAALKFALRHRHSFGSATPIVFCCTKPSMIAALDTSTHVFGVLSEYDVRGTIALARRLQPNAKHLYVISGASEMDRRFEAEARQLIDEFKSRLAIHYRGGTPRDELLKEISNVPPDSIVLFLTYLMDSAGRQVIPREMVALIAKAASAPTYGIFDTFIGAGIVGGRMDTFDSAGAAAAELAIQVLKGTVPTQARIRKLASQSLLIDARQLDRWNLPRVNLPTDAVVKFESQTIWETHRKAVIAAIAAFSAAIIALAVLLAQVRRRVKAEGRLRESDERLNFAAASGGIGLWQYDALNGKLWTSEHCRAIFGFAKDGPLTTETLLRRVHPRDRGIAAASIRAVTYGPHAKTLLEFRIVRPDGQIRSIQGTGRSTLDERGNPVRVSGVFRDLTAYRAAQKEARDLSRRILSIQDEERQRIAQELHDSTAQHLTAINLNLMAVSGICRSIAKSAPLFAEIQQSLVAAMNELRTFTYLLYPQELAQRGLLEALEGYIKGFSQRTGLVTILRTADELDDLPQGLQQSLLRIVQESLANVHRHASASRVTVKVLRRANRIHLLIADDGVGLGDAASMPTTEDSIPKLGIGIPGMTARARQLGGKLDVRSRPRGTLVHASLPIELHSTPSTAPGVSASGANTGNGGSVASIPMRRLWLVGRKPIRRTDDVRERQHSM
jgi:signal transduction histidine kinase